MTDPWLMMYERRRRQLSTAVGAAAKGLRSAVSYLSPWRQDALVGVSVAALMSSVGAGLDVATLGGVLVAMIAGLSSAANATSTAAVDLASTGDGGPSEGPQIPGGAGGKPAISSGWRALVDAFPDASIVLDEGGVILHCNGLARELFPKLRPGLPLSHVTRNPDLIDAIDRVGQASEPAVVQMLEWVPVERRVNATVSPLTVSPTTMSGVGSAQPHVLVTFRDLSEQDRLAQMRADFITNASHELRTPLASLRGFVETLQGPAKDDPKARERFLGLMASQAGRMTRLIDDLLSLSRVEMRVHLAPKGDVDLNEVASHVAQTVEPLAAASRITVSLTRPKTAARIRGDRDEIVQVLLNLVQNAIKYGRENGQIEVRIVRHAAQGGRPAQFHISVIDDGPGIAPEHLPRLTERFYRVNVASSREKGGTGLGLAIVKHIVNRHRGELRIASRLGEGSVFTVVVDEI